MCPTHEKAKGQVGENASPSCQHPPGSVISSTNKFSTNPRSKATTKVTCIFTIEDGVGALDKVLAILKNMNISLSRIESRPSKTAEWDYDFFVELGLFNSSDKEKTSPVKAQVEEVVEKLKPVVKSITIVGLGDEGIEGGNLNFKFGKSVPWFPRKLLDLDSFADKTLEYGSELEADHPGFHDPVYRARREEITRIAKTYRTGQAVPRIEYTSQEIETWGKVYSELKKLYPTHACKEHNYILPLLEQNCGYGVSSIPQLEDISRFLKECTGFTLRPVMGLLSSRDFLNALAFRVFYSTQYIRHASKPFYTPEPDVCHELLGHAPLFADPAFANFSQEIGLCSLGASDEDIEKLATIYWFTVEFGLCRQNGELKAYGAGLLSSFGELEYSINSTEPERRQFNPAETAVQKYPITSFQPIYFVAESFKAAQEKVREFSRTLTRPFAVRYDPYTQSIQVLDNKEKILSYANIIKNEMNNLAEALSHL